LIRFGVPSVLAPQWIRAFRMPLSPLTGFSANRREFLERAGKMMVSYIIDPNTGP
jgi:hypothetical protein